MRIIMLSLISFCLLVGSNSANGQPDANVSKYIAIIRKKHSSDYKGMYREPMESLKFPFWFREASNMEWIFGIGIRGFRTLLFDKFCLKMEMMRIKKEALKHEQGCVLNFLSYGGYDGWIPICLWPSSGPRQMHSGQSV